MTSSLRVAVTSLGCKVNYAEMAELAGAVAAAGCEVVPDDEPADVRVLNSCTVTLQADATSRQRLARLRREDPSAHIILTGCSVDGNPQRYGAGTTGAPPTGPADLIVTNAAKSRIADHIIDLARRAAHSAAPLPRQPALRARAFLKVQDGCDHRCTYCSVWQARGPAGSVSMASVVARARDQAAAGHGEIVLCGVDLGSYGHDRRSTLAELLRTLLAETDGVRFRLSSINANDLTDELIELNAQERICAHWHLPLQSGSDRVLRAMHRGYRRRQFLRVVGALRDADPTTELTTDVMVAFPGETPEDHGQTLGVIEEVGFLGCHVFRYSARPGTPAADLPERVPDRVARQRSGEVRRLAARCARSALERGLGRVHRVVWDRVDAGHAHGLSATYHVLVAAPGPGTRPGLVQSVIAERIEGDQLAGRLVHDDLDVAAPRLIPAGQPTGVPGAGMVGTA